MKPLHLIILYICASLLAACENEIPYRVGNQEPLLVMNAQLDADKEENFVYLNISEVHATAPVTQAVVTLSINGKQAEVAEELPFYGPEYDFMPDGDWKRAKKYRLSSRFRPGDVLRLEAVAQEGKYHAWAEVTVPQPLEKIQVDTCTVPIRYYGRMVPHRRFLVTVQDPPGRPDYYRLSILYDKTVSGTTVSGNDTVARSRLEAALVNQEDVVLTEGRPGSTDPDVNEDNDIFGNDFDNKYNVFTDTRFAGASYTLKVYSPLYEEQADHSFQHEVKVQSSVSIRLLSLTETGYRYLRILNTLEDDDYDEVLTSPAVIPSNVQGGIGLVDAFTAATASIGLPDKTVRADALLIYHVSCCLRFPIGHPSVP